MFLGRVRAKDLKEIFRLELESMRRTGLMGLNLNPPESVDAKSLWQSFVYIFIDKPTHAICVIYGD